MHEKNTLNFIETSIKKKKSFDLYLEEHILTFINSNKKFFKKDFRVQFGKNFYFGKSLKLGKDLSSGLHSVLYSSSMWY